jgi:hypothetical protein
MKRTVLTILLLASPALLFAQSNHREQGTIVRMHMTECMGSQHGFMAAMTGGVNVQATAFCPEYVLVADKVVYVITGKSSDQLIPLAETTYFHLQKNELLIRMDDSMKESHFRIKAMILRPEWDRSEMLHEAEASAMISHHLDPASTRNEQ